MVSMTRQQTYFLHDQLPKEPNIQIVQVSFQGWR